MNKKHNYPKTRKARDVSYSKSYKLLTAIGEEALRELFFKHGMYISSQKLKEEYGYEVTPYVVRHCRKRYKLAEEGQKHDTLWKRKRKIAE